MTGIRLAADSGRAEANAATLIAIADALDTGTAIPESERLARRFFLVFARGELAKLKELLHPEVEMVLKTPPPGEVLHGRDQVEAFVESELDRGFNEAHADVFRPLDEERIVVEGRVRSMDDQRVLRDDPMVWALEFRDGLLRRSLPAQTVLEAEGLLATSK